MRKVVASRDGNVAEGDQEYTLFELILRAKGGDEEAKEALLEHRELMQRCSRIAAAKLYAYPWVKVEWSVEDLTQELLLTLWRNLTKLNLSNGLNSLWAWLNKIAINRIISLRRRHLNTEIGSLEQSEVERLSPKRTDDPLSNLILKDAISSLPPRQQQILEAVIRGDTYEKIGANLSISKSSVERQLAAAYKWLREFLQGRSEKAGDWDDSE